ncbi:MAG: VOC family protein [Sphingobium sp.]
MPPSIRPVRLNHLNLVMADFEATIAHFRSLYGADFLADYPQAQLHAGLFEIGGVIFEPFVPLAWFLNARYGPHYLGVEYQADIDMVRAAIAERGIRIVRNVGPALHTHPDDTLGIAFQFYEGEFTQRTWDLLGGARMKPASYWRDEHPLGITGLAAYSIAVEDMDAAIAFLTAFLSAEQVREERRDHIGAQAVVLRIAGSMVDVLAPNGAGAIRRHLDRYGPGIRSTLFSVHDMAAVRDYFAAAGVALAVGDRPDGLMVPAEANLGIPFEFVAT